MNIDAFHAFLQNELPAPECDITARMVICHRALPRAYAGFPRDSAEVMAAMRLLERQGLAAKRDGIWWWKAEAAKVEPQGVLFA